MGFFHVTNILKHKNNHIFKLFNCFSFFICLVSLPFFLLFGEGGANPLSPILDPSLQSWKISNSNSLFGMYWEKSA